MAKCGNVFESGIYPTTLLNIKPEDIKNDDESIHLPKPILIGTPISSSSSTNSEDCFGILLLLHGYILSNTFYSQLIQHISSHGFIVIAPQLYTIAGPDSSDEIKNTAAIINWLSTGLKKVLPPTIKPDTQKVAISGHSRGGKVAFALALKKVTESPINISALIGIDPVDGMDIGQQTPPPVLSYVPNSFNLHGIPVLVIGSGFGPMRKNPIFPPCAPKGVNHENFYDECQSPAWYFVVKDYGHLDMLDDCTKGFKGMATYFLCKNGKNRGPMRMFIGGVIVAFLKAYLHGDCKQLVSIRDGDVVAPVEFVKVDNRTT